MVCAKVVIDRGGEGVGTASQHIVGRAAHHGVDRALHALDYGAFGSGLANDALDGLRLRLVVYCWAGRLHDLHRSAAHQGTAASAGA